MTPIETAIQATATAATAHGFVQALEQAAARMRARAAQLGDSNASEVPEGSSLVALELLSSANAIDAEVARRKAEVLHLQGLAQRAASEALSVATGPDMAKLRAAMAVILGAG